jgi:outer membrane protein assembly factor BamB
VNEKSPLSAFLTAILIVIMISVLAFVDSVHFGKAQTSTQTSTSNSVTQLWSFTTFGSVYTSPIIADGCIYALSSFEIGGNAGSIYCLNASTGTQIWNFTIIGYVYSALAVSGGYVYTGSGHGEAYALNASTGAQIWNFTTGNPVSTPTVSEGIVYVNGLYALNALTGAKIWNGSGSWVGIPPTVADGVVYIGSLYGGRVYALDAETGEQIWGSSVENYTLHSAPVVVDGHVYVVPDNGNVYCLDAHTGARIWNYSTGRSGNFFGKIWTPSITGGFAGFPVVVGGYTYVGSDNGVLHALNDSTGIEVWNYTTGGVVGSPSVADGYLYVGANSGDQGRLYVLNASTGASVWNYATEDISGPPTLTGPTETTAAPPVVSGSVVYFGSGSTVEPWSNMRGVNGTVHAFDALTGAQIWNYTIEHPVGYILVGNDMIYAVSAGGFGKNLNHPISSTIYALKPVTSLPLPLTFVMIVVVVAVVILLVVGVGLVIYFKKRKH